MKKLLLLRHGNAASRFSNMTDYDRPLDNTGKMQITNIANRLIEKRLMPNLIITSSALRAFSTTGIIKNIIQTSKKEKEAIIKISETELLYSAAIFEYIDILKTQKNSLESIMIVAHNPAISGFISKLTGKHIGMGTGNLCILEINIEKWSDLSFSSLVISSTLIKP
ncbi:MAG: histidine phosphatase family protein [Spirochaetales bacterium]|nr:histidine phosphatase family protein [Spirochaetales bacterium]